MWKTHIIWGFLEMAIENLTRYKPRLSIIQDKLDRVCEEYKLSPDLAFLKFSSSLILDMDINDIVEEFIVDGGQDKQIDLIAIDDDSTTQTATMNVFQIKNTESFSSNILVQIGNGLSWLMEQPFSTYSTIENRRFVSKIKQFRDLRSSYGPANITVNVYFITKGNTESLSSEFMSEYEKITAVYKSSGLKKFNFEVVGSIELVDYLNRTESNSRLVKEKIRINYDLNKHSILESPVTDKLKGVIVTVPANEIARVVLDDSNGVIFDKNIRKYLGKNGKINANILSTCSDAEKSKYFWFLNNGITIVCDSYDINKDADMPTVSVHNLQIVNGCQTSETLKHAFEAGALQEKTSVLVKIFATKDPHLMDGITISTNNQNSINNRDLKANDQVQIDLQAAFFEKFQLHYERKRNEFKVNPDIDRSKIIKNEKVAQAFLSFGRKKPSLARDKVSKIFSEEKIYKEIFDNADVVQMAFCYKLLTYTESKQKSSLQLLGKNDLALDMVSYGNLHITRILGALLQDKDSFLPADKLLELITKIDGNDSTVHEVYAKSLALFEKVLRSNQKQFTSVANFTKNATLQSLLNKEIDLIYNPTKVVKKVGQKKPKKTIRRNSTAKKNTTGRNVVNTKTIRK